MRDDDREKIKLHCRQICKEVGIDVDYVHLCIGDVLDHIDRIEIWHCTEELLFSSLVTLSERLGTRDIDLSCDLGCASDRSHDPIIMVNNPSIEAIQRILGGNSESASS